MKFTLEIKSDNAAFADGNAANETARILREVANKIEGGSEDGFGFGGVDGYAFDCNGNKVGTYALDLPEPDEDEDETEEGAE